MLKGGNSCGGNDGNKRANILTGTENDDLIEGGAVMTLCRVWVATTPWLAAEMTIALTAVLAY